MVRHVGWQDRFRYRFDRLLSRGSAATIGWVVAMGALLATVGGVVFWVLGLDFDGRSGPAEAMWQAFLIAIGSGGILDNNWLTRVVTFLFVFAGVFLTGSLIGVLVAAVTKRVDELRRGRARILESGHTVVIGWSPRLMTVLDELLAENIDRRGVQIVVLADRDKQQMEDEFRSRHSGPNRDKVLFRTGDASRPGDLELVGVEEARAVIVLSEGSLVDAIAVKRALIAHTVEPDEAHVVVEIGNPRVARSVSASTAEAVAVVTVDDVVADMLAQAIRHNHLAQVFDEMLSYGGSELYVVPAGLLQGARFWKASHLLDGVALLGLIDSAGVLTMLPSDDRVIAGSDRLVVLSKDSTVETTTSSVDFSAADCVPEVTAPVSVVMIGWNETAAGALDRLGEYLPSDSRIEVLADTTMLKGGQPDWWWPMKGSFTHTKHDPAQILGTIDEVQPDVVVVLGYSDGLTHPEADAMTLLTLMTLERARESGRIDSGRTVAHLFDRELAPLARAHCRIEDMVISDALTSRLIAHASRDPAIANVHRELFDPDGPFIDLVEMTAGHLTFGEAVLACSANQMIPIGVLVNGKVTVTPRRTDVFDLGADDRVIVVRTNDLREIELTFE